MSKLGRKSLNLNPDRVMMGVVAGLSIAALIQATWLMRKLVEFIDIEERRLDMQFQDYVDDKFDQIIEDNPDLSD